MTTTDKTAAIEAAMALLFGVERRRAADNHYLQTGVVRCPACGARARHEIQAVWPDPAVAHWEVQGPLGGASPDVEHHGEWNNIPPWFQCGSCAAQWLAPHGVDAFEYVQSGPTPDLDLLGLVQQLGLLGKQALNLRLHPGLPRDQVAAIKDAQEALREAVHSVKQLRRGTDLGGIGPMTTDGGDE